MNLLQSKTCTALVTGGSRGIGREVSLRLAQTCAHTIIVNYLQDDASAEEAKRLVEENDSTCILAKANLMFPDEIDRLFETVKSSVDCLDVFVHCAALGAFKPLLQVKPNQWDLTMNVDARGFLLCVQKAVPLMKQGSIVAISSLGSVRTIPNYGAMGPTKAALESIIRYLAVELAPLGIRVNGVTGGFIETDSLAKIPGADDLIREVIEKTPRKRIGTPADIAKVVLFLNSPDADWIIGQTIVVDGGVSLI